MAGLRERVYHLYTNIETRQHELLYLFFEITRRCNLSCRHCGSDCARDAHFGEMDRETWCSIIDYIAAHFPQKPFIVITGGEPTVRHDLPEIAQHLHKHGFNWGMVTNGVLLTKDMLDNLVEKGLSSITLSWDGNEAAQLYVRKNPHIFSYTSRALGIIGASQVSIKDAVTCVYPGNLGQLDEIAATLCDAGISSWRLFRIFPNGRARDDESLLLDHAQSHVMLQWIANNRGSWKQKGLSINFSCEGYLPWKLDRKVRDEPFFCRAGINIASILSDGTITACNNNHPGFAQGNIAQDDFLQVWNTRFHQYRNKKWLQTGACTNCKEWKRCGGSSMHLRSPEGQGPNFCFLGF